MKLLAAVTATLLLTLFAFGCGTFFRAPTSPQPDITTQPEILTHQLEVKADPREAADFLFNPKPLGKGGYVSGRTVTIDVLAKPGWEVEEWVGPVYGVTGQTATIDMDISQTVVVRLRQSSTRLAANPPPLETEARRTSSPNSTAGTTPTPTPRSRLPLQAIVETPAFAPIAVPTATAGASTGARVVVKEVPVTVEVPVTRVVVKEVPVTVVVVATPTPQPASRSTGSGGTGPDLVIEEVTSQPANPAAGDKVTWDVRVRNQGLGNANGFTTALKKGPNADCSRYSSSAKADLNFVGAGQVETVRLTLTVRAGRTYWLVADSCGKVQETDEGNNSLRIQLSMADLVIEGVTSQPAKPAAGDKVTWDVRVRNQGLGNANGFTTALKKGPNADCSRYSSSAKADLNFVGAGQVETVRLTLTVRAGTSYWLVVDSCGKVPETDETNNSFQFGQVR